MTKKKTYLTYENPNLKGYGIDLTQFRLEIYRLVSIYMSEEKIADNIEKGNEELWKLVAFSESEIHKLLISIAINSRIFDDKQEYFMKDIQVTKCYMKSEGKRTKVSLRDICNKIIHAKDIMPVIKKSRGKEVFPLLPEFLLKGTERKKEWTVKVDLMNFSTALLKYIDYPDETGEPREGEDDAALIETKI